jgi:DNA-binding CsgD family transcriptional regulator
VQSFLSNDPEQSPAIAIESLQLLFGLSRAQAAVCRELVSGNSAAEIAKVLDLSPSTVRRHLEAIFEKTRTSRQATLVKLVLSSVVTKVATTPDYSSKLVSEIATFESPNQVKRDE